MGECKRLALVVLITIGACLMSGASAGGAQPGETEEVVAAVARDLYPEYMVDAGGRPGGFSIDLMNEVASRAGLRVTYRVFETWSGIITALERGDVDLIPVLSITPAREQSMLFTRPVLTSPASLFVKRENDRIHGWSDVDGRRIGVIASGVSGQLMSERYESAVIVPYSDFQDVLFALLTGEVDALVSFQSAVWKVSDRAGIADRIKVVGDPLDEVSRAMAVRQELPALRDRLDAVIAEFLNSPEYRKLSAKWYSAPPPFLTSGRVGWLAGACTALLLLGMLLWQALSLRAERRQLAESALVKRAAVESRTPVISRTLSLVAIALGLAVLFGWAFDVNVLKSVLPGLFPMQPWAAITLVLAGGALLAATVPGRIATATSVTLAGGVLIIGLEMLLQHVTGLDFGTDRWFFPEAVGNQPYHSHPGRVAEVTAIAFVLLGLVLLLARAERAWARGAFSTIGTVGLLLMAAPLLGYLIGAGVLQSVAFFTPIALHAALGLVVLFVGVLALYPDTGWTGLLSGDLPGAVSARMLLPVIITGPLLLAWLFAAGKQAGFYGPEFQIGLVTLATIALLATSLLWSGGRVDRLHRAQLAGAAALRESERRAQAQLDELETIYRTAPLGLALYSRDLKFMRINSALADINGASIEEHLGRYVWDVVPHLREAVDPHFRKVLTGETVVFEVSGETPKLPGVQRDWLAHYYPLKGPDGSVVAIGAIVEEITERKQRERALNEAVAQYKAMGESVPYGVWLCGPDGGAHYVSQSFLELLDMTMEEMQQFGWTKRLPPEDVEPMLQRWLHCVRTGEPWDSEHWIIAPSGEVRYVLTRGRPVRDAEGRITSWAGINLDITERKRAEQALRESEARYRTAGEAIHYGVWVCNSEGGVEFVSQIFLDLIGKTLDEVRPRGWLDRLPPEDLKPTLDAWRECVRTGSEWNWEHRVRSKDGVWRTILSLGRPVRDDRDRITSWVGFNLDISRRKEAEDALRESEARFRGTFENAAVGIANVGMDGAWLRVNQRLCEILGYSRDELLQKNFQEVTHPEDLPFNLDRFTALMCGEIDRYQLEKRYLHKDGHAIWVDLTSAIQCDQAGNPAYCIAIIQDISARKRAEQALRESEVRMRALLDASQDEILLLSAQGEVLAINRAAERRLARRMGGADPVGAHLDQLLPWDQVESRMAIVRQVAATATLVHCEVPIRSRYFEFWFYPVLEADKTVFEVAVYAREITQQKKSQADLSKLFQAIQQSPMSVVITDREGTIEYINPEFTKVTGYTLVEAVGRNPRILRSGHTPPEEYKNLWTTISAGGVWRGEFLNKKKNGELFWELASIAPVKDGEKIINFVAVKEDITERKEMEEQLRQSQKMQAVGQLTGGIAHDFNNLLAIIIGNLQLLGERPIDDTKVREYLDDALWSARRGAELTSRLLAFARKQPLKPTIINLNEVVRSMTELLCRTLGASIRVETSLAPNLWKAFADRGEFERALVNLAVNARDAMRSAGILTLETRNAILDKDYAEQHQEVTPGEYVLLAVTDTGVGMSSEIVSRVFEPFFTTKEVGQGSGLGLSMVYGFIKQSAGHISIYSRVSQGTCVKLYLPRSPSLPARPEEGFPDVPAEGFGEMVVLVVEDEPKLRKVAVKMLERLGLRSLQAETAKAALAILADTHVDILFTDIELPGDMNGTELVEAAQKLVPNIKVLFTTGYARESVLRDKWLQKKIPWLLKPYSHTELARELKALLAPAIH